MDSPVRSMDAAAAAEVLKSKIPDARKPLTVADAAVASGLALREAEAGLHHLTSEYRGHLRVTEDGDLVHVFPHGFTKPWERRELVQEIAGAIGRGVVGVGRFVVRAWLLVVMIAYALLFVALFIGLTFARQGGNDRDDTGSAVLGGLLRMIADAMFWTFHPFSPFYVDVDVGRSFRRAAPDVPFYEKVNRFVFGPAVRTPDPRATQTLVLEEIRRQRGRIGLADVMRVTGLPRDEADPMMARLMLDYDGEVDVADEGGIVYRFEALRRTATAESASTSRPAPAAWSMRRELPPLTGNTAGANTAIALLNFLNACAAAFVLSHGLTISNILRLFERTPHGRPPVLVDDGMPIALGLVPLVFSLAVLALPLLRAAWRTRKRARVAAENARLAILREVLTRAPKKQPVPDETLRGAYRVATGTEPSSKEITRQVVALGGDVDVGPEGEVRYRFADLEAEAEALEDERARASEAEARLGRVVFTSEN